jgi:hypothetical protein
MNKDTILKDLALKIQIVRAQVASVKKIELNTVYKYLEHTYDQSTSSIELFETYGYFESYNRESARFVVIATDSPKYSDAKGRGERGYTIALEYVDLSETKWKTSSMIEAKITSLASKLSPMKETDLPLLVGMKYKSPEYEKILKGRKRLKYA